MITTLSSRRTRISVAALATAGLAAAVLMDGPSTASAASPGAAARPAAQAMATRFAASPMAAPSATPTCSGTAAARSCDLWAKAGSVRLPGTPGYPALPVWGFTDSAAGAAGLVGPTIVLAAGDKVTFHLHNTVSGTSVSLNIPSAEGLSPVSDHVGAAPGATADYTFDASRPGTYLYEAGATRDQSVQLAMGLVGALIVRPANPARAYDDASTAFTDESVLVLSEVDPRVNQSPDPTAFDMGSFVPGYRLINGHPYPDTETVPAAAGGQLLLRMINGGSQDHAMSLFGPHQRVISDDSTPLAVAQQYSVAAETIGVGQSLDTIVSIPASAPGGRRYVLADGGGELFNPQGATPSATVAFGGMLTEIVVGGIAPPPTCTPSVATVSASPTALAPGGSTNLIATLSPCPGVPLSGAQYSDGPSGPWTAMALTGTTASATVTGLTNGRHTLYVRASDAGGPGDPGTVEVYVDGTGPTTTGLSVAPDPHRTAAGALTVRATGDDSVTGAANVVAAEAFDGGVVGVGTPTPPANAPGTGTPLPLTSGGGTPAAGFVGALTVAGTNGRHAIWVRSKDARNNWGAFAYVLMTEDNAAPVRTAATTPTVVPNPTNGLAGFNPQSPYVRVTVSASDTLSVVTGMRGWVDTVSGPGTVLLAADGAWNSTTEVGQLLVPLPTIRNLANGTHQMLVQATDAAGNVSATISVPFTVDKIAPVITSLVRATPGRRITVKGTDAVAVTGAEYFRGADPGPGKATQVAITPALSVTKTFPVPVAGTYLVRLRDAAGNWSATSRVVIP